MMTVVSVKFKGNGKTYFFDPRDLEVPAGVSVVVETSAGLELCECVQGNHTVTDSRIVPPLRPVIRIATKDDLRVAELCKKREQEAFGICEQRIAAHGLEMKLVAAECSFDGNKILFSFTADGRVDFRELVKDLAGIFRTRIELRQIGVRDEAKLLGGIGICGRPYCCSEFLDDFCPVSTKMAKTQSLSLNPAKISGSCGRLMCCLRFEQAAYEELVKNVPKQGAFVETPDGYGTVAQVNLLCQKVKVRPDGDEDSLRTYDAEDVAAIPGGRPKNGEPLPHVLQPRAKKPDKEAEETKSAADEWLASPMFAEDTAEQPEPEKKSGSRRNRHGRRGGKKSGGEQAEKQAPAQPPRQETAAGGKQQNPAGGKQQGGADEKPSGQKSSHGNRRRGNKKKPAGEAGEAQKANENQGRQPKQGEGQPQKKQNTNQNGNKNGNQNGNKSGNQSGNQNGNRGPKQAAQQPKPAQNGGAVGADAPKKPSSHRGHRGGKNRGGKKPAGENKGPAE